LQIIAIIIACELDIAIIIAGKLDIAILIAQRWNIAMTNNIIVPTPASR